VALVFACAMGHAPGITAWREAAPPAQSQVLYGAFEELRQRLEAAQVEALLLFTAEHWANFFLDHISPFCIGVGDSFEGPIEPWVKIGKAKIRGLPELAGAVLAACQAHDIDLAFAHELKLDHGTMIPLHFLTPEMGVPIVPIVINTLAPPLPTPRRCFELGRIVGDALRSFPKRVGLIATGGMSHDPGERKHGFIDQEFDRKFLEGMRRTDRIAMRDYTAGELAAAGGGAPELLNWIALAGAMPAVSGEVLAYEAVVPWATGIGAMHFDVAAAR
jgi:aromatic ring-opening dioxygenase catalytic subunit (LigB family)